MRPRRPRCLQINGRVIMNDRNAVDPAVTRQSLKARLLRLTPVVLVLAALIIGILPRLNAHAALRAQTESFSIPVVSVVHPKAAPAVQRIELPADVQAYQEASIFARTNGYLAHWYKDIGTPVPAGELLATIETPEVDAQLEQALADEHTAKVQYDIAKVTADRWVALLKTNAVSREVAEQDVAAMKARAATLAATEANVQRLRKLQSYEKVVAPFAGVVTARNIPFGGNGQAAGFRRRPAGLRPRRTARRTGNADSAAAAGPPLARRGRADLGCDRFRQPYPARRGRCRQPGQRRFAGRLRAGRSGCDGVPPAPVRAREHAAVPPERRAGGGRRYGRQGATANC
jgi:hypothetical protein